MPPPPQSGLAPIQSDSLAINFAFDIRPRAVRPSVRCFFVFALNKIATRGQILRLKCTKFDFRWGSTPDTAGGAYSVPPDPLAVFKGPTSKGKEREGDGKGW